MSDAAAPARDAPSAAQLRVLMEHLNRINPAFTEIAKGVADRRAGDRKARVNTAVAQLTPLLPLADTPHHMEDYELPANRVANMAVAVHNRKVPDEDLLPVRQLVNSDDAKSVLADAIRELHQQGVPNAPERVAALYIASQLPKIKGAPTMRQLSHRTREIRRLTGEFDRRLHGAIWGMQEERGVQDVVRAKGRTGLSGGGRRMRTRKKSKGRKGHKGRKPDRRTRRRTRKRVQGESKKGRKGTRRSGRR